ncbi:hypothetical protein HDV05_000028 [Chytridiales sp. JEL 0842]|nr:hypothetical protein HDV05_000028 [Chytridiales sp. JEL 0842]
MQDEVKKKYFKILPDQKAPPGHAYSKGSIKRKEEEWHASQLEVAFKKQCLDNEKYTKRIQGSARYRSLHILRCDAETGNVSGLTYRRTGWETLVCSFKKTSFLHLDDLPNQVSDFDVGAYFSFLKKKQ